MINQLVKIRKFRIILNGTLVVLLTSVLFYETKSAQAQTFSNIDLAYGISTPFGTFAGTSNNRRSGFATQGDTWSVSFFRTRTQTGPISTGHSIGYCFRLGFHSFEHNRAALQNFILQDLNQNAAVFSPPVPTRNSWSITELSFLGFNINMPLERTELDIYSMFGLLVGSPVLYEMEFTNYTPVELGKFFLTEDNINTRSRENPMGFLWTMGMRMNYMLGKSFGFRIAGELLLGTQGFRGGFINTTIVGNTIQVNNVIQSYRQNYAALQFNGGIILRFM